MKLIDFFRVDPESALVSLSKTEKHKLIDSAMVEESGLPRGISVTLDQTHSARRINNRIYLPKSQEASLPTWVEPYRKPVFINHNTKGDPIGRFSAVDYVSLEKEASKFFKSIKDFVSFKNAFDTGNPKRIYKAMLDNNLFFNTAWPGLSKLVSTVRITDKDAIEKFLDGRYLTFSSGAVTDSYVCGICNSDWMQGDICEHRPGSIHDGMPAVFITGAYWGEELSVANMPADSSSVVLSIEYDGKTVLPQDILNDSFNQDLHTMHISDMKVAVDGVLQDNVEQEAPALMDARVFVAGLFAGTEESAKLLEDVLSASTHYERVWLTRVHDALHSEYDWKLRWEEKDSIPADVYKLHASLHELAMSSGFRDSFVNGKLDEYDGSAMESDAFVAEHLKKAEDAVTPETLQAHVNTIVETVLAALKDNAPKEPETEDTEESLEDSDVAEEPPQVVPEVDWKILDLALNAVIGDKAVDTATLEDSVYCAEKFVPVPNKDYAEAIKSLVAESKMSDAAKAIVLAAVAEKESAFPAEPTLEDSLKSLQEKYDKLVQDYATALETIENLKHTEEVPVEDNLGTDLGIAPVTLEDTETDENQPKKKSLGELTDFQKKFIKKYRDLTDSGREDEAFSLLTIYKNRRYLPFTFNPDSYES